jgi:hypothetical protein
MAMARAAPQRPIISARGSPHQGWVLVRSSLPGACRLDRGVRPSFQRLIRGCCTVPGERGGSNKSAEAVDHSVSTPYRNARRNVEPKLPVRIQLVCMSQRRCHVRKRPDQLDRLAGARRQAHVPVGHKPGVRPAHHRNLSRRADTSVTRASDSTPDLPARSRHGSESDAAHGSMLTVPAVALTAGSTSYGVRGTRDDPRRTNTFGCASVRPACRRYLPRRGYGVIVRPARRPGARARRSRISHFPCEIAVSARTPCKRLVSHLNVVDA